MTSAPQFYCYAPRPKHVNLPPLESAIYDVLSKARGIFRKSMSESLIHALVMADHCGEIGTAPSLREVKAGLWRMRGLEIVEQCARDFGWRIKR